MKFSFLLNRLKYLAREKLRELIIVPKMYKQRQRVLGDASLKMGRNDSKKVDSLLLLTPHTSNPFASRGDEAMLVAVVSKFKAQNSNFKCAILVEKNIEESVATRLESMGIEPIKSWVYPWQLSQQVKYLSCFDALFCIGADVMDGYYSAIKSLRMWMCADVMAQMGKPSTVGGFSFNEKPSQYVVEFIVNHISSKVNICLRDPVSYRRFEKKCGVKACLVADNAFMLEAQVTENYTQNAVDWSEKKQQQGRRVCALNLHPILIKNRNPDVINQLVISAVDTVRTLIEDDSVSFVLLPHDFRDSNTGDLWFLGEVYNALPELTEDLFFVTQEIPATDIKYIASKMELVVTGRMHLAIGALGKGTPIMGVTYQGKFEGLIEHFGLSEDLLATPQSLLNPQYFTEFFRYGLEQSSALKNIVASELPRVKVKSYKNISDLIL